MGPNASRPAPDTLATGTLSDYARSAGNPHQRECVTGEQPPAPLPPGNGRVSAVCEHPSVDRFRFGRAIKAIRIEQGWRQEDLAIRARVSRSAVGRMEAGQIERMSLAQIQAVALATGGQFGVDFRWRGADLERLLDEDHAGIAELLAGMYRNAGWDDVVVEATFSEGGERGSIDVLAWHRPTAIVAVNEVKATVADAGNTLAGVDRKVRLAPIVARRRGWTCRAVARVLAIADTRTARRRVDAHAGLFRGAFPLGGREVLAWIRDPAQPAVAGILFVPTSRGQGPTARLPGRQRVRRRSPRPPSSS
jgi:transcriptional regulator with XRE-family HTH domain